MKTENEMQVTALQRFFEENSNVCIRALSYLTANLGLWQKIYVRL